MTEPHTRRGFLQQVGAVGVAGHIQPAASGSRGDAGERPTAADLVVSATEAPPGFEPYETLDSPPLLEALAPSALDRADTDIAVRRYWKGSTASEPEWVLSTLAIVGADPLPRAPLEAATRQADDEYVSAYDAETNLLVDFERTYTRREEVSDRRIDIVRSPVFEVCGDATHLFTDRLRQQFLGRVVLGTLVFGPADAAPSVDSRLADYAAMQRTHYETHETTS